MTFECPICLDNIKYATVGSCMHHFCYFCIFKHCKFNNKCPMCKTLITELKLDREFDTLINNETLPTLKFTNETIIKYSDYKENKINDPGLTIQNNNGPGVVITDIKSNGLFHKYSFKKGDILLFINEIPCNNHHYVMKQIMNLFQSNKQMKIIKL